MSAAGALHALNNAKAALDASLITQSDFDQVKDAFLKAQVWWLWHLLQGHSGMNAASSYAGRGGLSHAVRSTGQRRASVTSRFIAKLIATQQIRAGLDAGFILEQDYQAVKHAFLESLQLSSARDVSSTLRAPRLACSWQDLPVLPEPIKSVILVLVQLLPARDVSVRVRLFAAADLFDAVRARVRAYVRAFLRACSFCKASS